MMMKILRFLFYLLIPVFLTNCVEKAGNEFSKLSEIPFDKVQVNDHFWSPRIQTIQDTTIFDLLKILEDQGKIDNLRIIAGRKKDGKIRITNSPDSDIWKIMEGASYTLAWRYDEEVDRMLDDLIELYAEVQDEDGYINQMYMLPRDHPQNPPNLEQHRHGPGSEQRWRGSIEEWPRGLGQLYSAGHLFEAAAAHYRATGKKNFLNIAIKKAENIYREFPPGKPIEYADHPQIEIGLVKLYEVTGEQKWLELANHITHHGNHARPPDMGDRESWKPIVEQRKAWGHAVRINYLYSGATDLVRYLGQPETREALESLWHSINDRRIYLHGGVGGPAPYEQLADDWNLNPATTYSECCANIAHGQWNHRLNLLYGNSKFADIIEIGAYNGALSGISLDGKKYFYTNKLTVDTNNRNNPHSGVRERYLFCCPSKLPGFVSGIGRWIYARDADGLYVNLYIGSTVNTEFNGKKVTVTQQTGYPWEENTLFTIHPESPQRFTIYLRIPGWARTSGPFPSDLYRFADNKHIDWKVSVNDKEITVSDLKDGYFQITRKWKPGDKVELILPMPVRQVLSHPEVEATKGKVALMRGPVLYCLEGMDNNFNVLEAALVPNSKIKHEHKPNLLGGVTVLTGNVLTSKEETVEFMAIPYYAWQNRGIDRMTAWLFQNFEILEDATIKIEGDKEVYDGTPDG